jgi:hypothetical protein
MSKPFTSDVTEKTEISFENHCEWDRVGFAYGIEVHALKGPAVKALELRRGEPG